MGTRLPPLLKGHSPQFSAHVSCGQTAGWTKMPLGMEVGFGPCDCVRWGPSSPPEKGHTPTQFSAHVYCGQTARWMKTPLGMEVDLGPGHIVLDGDPAPPRKGHCSPHHLFPPYLLWPWLRLSATAEFLIGNSENIIFT